MKQAVLQTTINWKSINPEHENYEVPVLMKNKILDEQDWLDTCNHTGSDLLLLLVETLGEQQITLGYYYEHEYRVYGGAEGLPDVMIKRKYFSDLRYTIHAHEVENVLGWCYHKDVTNAVGANVEVTQCVN